MTSTLVTQGTNSRKYRQKRRAALKSGTRQRIVDAAIGLHAEVGGEGATITAIADRAGVGRVTVYRHFPDERSLLMACTSHYVGQHPLPDPGSWSFEGAPESWLLAILANLYDYHAENEMMMTRAAADGVSNPTLAELLQPLVEYWNSVRDMLAGVLVAPALPSAQFTALVGHLVSFGAWQSLRRQHGIDQSDAIALTTATLLKMAKSELATPGR